MFKDAGYGIESDDFNHELIISFSTDNLFVYTGCAHKGLLNILGSISLFPSKRIETVMGGFHLLDSKTWSNNLKPKQKLIKLRMNLK